MLLKLDVVSDVAPLSRLSNALAALSDFAFASAFARASVSAATSALAFSDLAISSVIRSMRFVSYRAASARAKASDQVEGMCGEQFG